MQEAVNRARLLCFDTNALIYLVDRVQPYFGWLERVFGDVESGQKQAIFSVVTEAEAMVKPLRDKDADTLDKIRVAFHNRNTTEIIVDRRVALEAAAVRAATDIKLPDAIIVATAIISGCDVLIGNDKVCASRVTEIPYIYLDDIVKA